MHEAEHMVKTKRQYKRKSVACDQDLVVCYGMFEFVVLLSGCVAYAFVRGRVGEGSELQGGG